MDVNDQTTMNKQKRGLLITMMQRKFENEVYDYLNNETFDNMESLDKWLDGALTQYFEECDAIKEYYDDKIYS